ncbi:MAG: GNAT family N-acetyltransferase [Candidatus Delongbacteria bacterium]|nr:GNAT family N-acetyltransferase [Candidatus Delongbacteria bacterium]
MTKADIEYYFSDFEDTDYDELVNFWEDTGVGGKHRGDNVKIINETVKNGGKLILMKMKPDGIIIGSAWVTTDKRRSYLHYFAIAEDLRGKGLAKKLMNEVMVHAEKLGLQFRLEVHIDNAAAISLYERYGFGYLGDYDIYINRSVQKK